MGDEQLVDAPGNEGTSAAMYRKTSLYAKTAGGVLTPVLVDADGKVQVNAVSADFGLLTETDVVTNVTKNDRRTWWITKNTGAGKTLTKAAIEGSTHVVTGYIVTCSDTASTVTLNTGATARIITGHQTAASQLRTDVVTLSQPIPAAVNEAVTLVDAGGGATTQLCLMGYSV